MRRRTKIVCTIGPVSSTWEVLVALAEAGMNAVRINMSHASYDEAAQTIEWARQLNRKAKYAIPVMLDTSGPEVRTGRLAESLRLATGEEIWLRRVGEHQAGTKDIEIEYPGFLEVLNKNDVVKLDNGLINLYVIEKDSSGLRCRVEDEGVLGSRKHVNFPGKHINLPSISRKDLEVVQFAIEHDVDFIAQSFVRAADDVTSMREIIGGKNPKIIAKIENHEGVAAAAEISQRADAVMVARGDLGIETDISGMPNLQRQLVQTTVRTGRRCIVATHMLESMVEHPIPTRAEVVDVANAIYEGVDAVLLSGETSIGKYPVRSVEQVVRIAEASEQLPGLDFAKSLLSNTQKQLLARSAVELAERVEASGIVVITRSGQTADLVTNCAPAGVPIFAFTDLERTRRSLMLSRSTYSHQVPFSSNPETTILAAMDVLVGNEGMTDKDKVVVLSDVLSVGGVAAIQVRRVALTESHQAM